MIIYIPYYLNWLHKEIKTIQFSTDQFNSILQSETTKNFHSHKMCFLSLDENVVWFPPGFSSLQVVLPFCPGLSQQCSLLPILEFNLMLAVCGRWQLDQFRSLRGTCKLKQKSRLHYIDVPLLFCAPASSLCYLTWFSQTNSSFSSI